MAAADRNSGDRFAQAYFVQRGCEEDAGTEPRRSRILVCEDEIFIMLAEVDLLERHGYEVVGTADTCEAAVDTCARQRPDLVLLDISLQGDGDGVNAAMEIRRRFAIPFVFVTAHSNDITAVRARKAAPAGYVAKPYDDRELLCAVRDALHA